MKIRFLLSSFFALIFSAGMLSAQDISYKPELYGLIKAKAEVSFYDGMYRVSIRNARLGARGFVADGLSYNVHADFSNDGDVMLLDALAAYTTGNFSFSFGQQTINFNGDFDRGPSLNVFINATLMTSYLTNFYGESVRYFYGESTTGGVYSKSYGTRDLGLMTHYNLSKGRVPVHAIFGLLTGMGMNDFRWTNHLNVVARLNLGGERGFRVGVSHYNGKTPYLNRVVHTIGGDETEEHRLKYVMWGGELRYATDEFVIEGEYAQRRLRNDGLRLLHTGVVQSYYTFRLPKGRVSYITPLLRWDIGSNVDYVNMVSREIDAFTANRATVGVNFGFDRKFLVSELRVNFEKFFFKDKISDLSENRHLQDKVSVELFVSF